MHQMWSTHTVVVTELGMLCQGMYCMLDPLYWTKEGKREGGIPEVTEEEETMSR